MHAQRLTFMLWWVYTSGSGVDGNVSCTFSITATLLHLIYIFHNPGWLWVFLPILNVIFLSLAIPLMSSYFIMPPITPSGPTHLRWARLRYSNSFLWITWFCGVYHAESQCSICRDQGKAIFHLNGLWWSRSKCSKMQVRSTGSVSWYLLTWDADGCNSVHSLSH